MNNFTNDQKKTIMDIYQGNIDFSDPSEYYLSHNTIYNGIELGDRLSTINNVHSINNSYFTSDNVDTRNMPFYPLMSIPETSWATNYKLISAKDIDYENAYLKYAANQISEYQSPIELTQLVFNGEQYEPEIINVDSYIFNREISPYINSTYDLLNIVDYLFNRFNCFTYLLDQVKHQRMVTNKENKIENEIT